MTSPAMRIGVLKETAPRERRVLPQDRLRSVTAVRMAPVATSVAADMAISASAIVMPNSISGDRPQLA